MASDRQQFRNAVSNWEQLHADEAYSAPPHFGRTAVLCSYVVEFPTVDDEGDIKQKQAPRDVKIFRNEAFAVAEEIEAEGGEAEVILNASTNDLSSILHNPYYSTIVSIGHGCLSSMFIRNDGSNYIDWRTVARSADHLKRGIFIQRHCGNFGATLAVPFGAFAMADHRNVFAPVGESFEPRGLRHPENKKLVSVSETRCLTYRDIKTRFAYEKPPREELDDIELAG